MTKAWPAYIGDDFRRVGAHYAGPPELAPNANLSPSSTGRTPFGIERHGIGYGQPLHPPPLAGATLAEIAAYPWPDPAWMDVSTLREEALRWERQYAILGGDWSPFFHDAIDLLGMEKLMLLMYDDPPLVDALLGHLVDYYAAVSERIFQATGDALDLFFIGNDLGTQTGPAIGAPLFRRFLLPHLARLIELGHRHGLLVLLHCCGGFAPLLPDLIAAGLDGVQAVQPACRGMEPSWLKAQYGGQMTFMGCIDSQLLIQGTAEEARAETRRILEIMKPGGGYVASPSHDYVLPETPLENVLAVYEAVREFGYYHEVE